MSIVPGAHVKVAASSAGAYHGCNLAWGLDFARGMDESWPQRQREASRYLLF